MGGDVFGIRNIEGDSTLVRKMKVGANSKTFAKEIAAAKKLLKKREEKHKAAHKRVMKKLKPTRFVFVSEIQKI